MTLNRRIDFTPLDRLLHLAGPAGAAALLAAFLDDLGTAQRHMERAWNGPDFAALRANSHVLMAIAGTVGDMDLHASAQQLNKVAHDESLGEHLEKTQKIMIGLSELIAQLKTKAGAW